MVWPAFEEGKDPLVDEEVVTPVIKINPRESSKVEHIDASGNPGDDVNHAISMKDGDSEAVTSEAWSSPELKKTALIKEQASEELRIDSCFQDNPNKVGSVEEEELTLKSIPLLKNAKISNNPNQFPQDSILPQQSQLQLEDNGPRREANNGSAALMQAQEDATAGLMKAIQDQSPTRILMSFVEKGADVNIKVDVPDRWSTALQLGISWGDKEFVTVLLAHGADPNIQGEKVFQFQQGGT
ncbi:hypothetical protein B0H13DRAFT_2043518 [Mycena leptocephala]|nr:hypothetical protein B0H13DRAFT_2043518 [Mycena leptocephala]